MLNEAPPSGAIFRQILFLHKLYKTCPKDAVCQISEYLDCQFMRRFCKIHQIVHLFALYWATIGGSPLIFAKLNPHSLMILPTKSGSNQFSGFGEEVVLRKGLWTDGRDMITIAHLSLRLR